MTRSWPRREPTEQELELQARIQRARDNTWTVIIAGVLALIGGIVAILTGLVALGAPLLVAGIVAGVLGERRLARLSAAERLVRQWGETGPPPRFWGIAFAWGFAADQDGLDDGRGADFGGDGGSDP
jgi:hypothetical protein